MIIQYQEQVIELRMLTLYGQQTVQEDLGPAAILETHTASDLWKVTIADEIYGRMRRPAVIDRRCDRARVFPHASESRDHNRRIHPRLPLLNSLVWC